MLQIRQAHAVDAGRVPSRPAPPDQTADVEQ
jgi:hypothetical protein